MPGFPFHDINMDMSENHTDSISIDVVRRKIEEAEAAISEGRYESADIVIKRLRERYGIALSSEDQQ